MKIAAKLRIAEEKYQNTCIEAFFRRSDRQPVMKLHQKVQSCDKQWYGSAWASKSHSLYIYYTRMNFIAQVEEHLRDLGAEARKKHPGMSFSRAAEQIPHSVADRHSVNSSLTTLFIL